MQEQRITLIDVMRGVKKHKLADKLQDGVYKFLIELILEANELGFKNPIDLTVKQALAIGGGESRQSLYNRRNALKKIMLDGKHLVKVVVGHYGKRSLATYEIDYELLSLYNGVWKGEKDYTSNEIYEAFTKPLRDRDGTLYDALPILRSDQKRGDEINPPNPPNLVSEINVPENDSEVGGVSQSHDEEEESEEEMRKSRKVAHIQDLILRKWSKQLTAKPPIGKVKDALREFGWDHMPMETALNKAPDTLNSPHPIAALNLVIAIARKSPGRNGGLTPERLADAEASIKQMEEDLKKAKEKPEENAAYIEQTEFLLEQKKDALERAGEK